jgi:Xaa-Pro dipeptidase
MLARADSDFAQLVKDLNNEQLALMETRSKSGVRYTDYHVQMHQRIAKLLKSAQTGVAVSAKKPWWNKGLPRHSCRTVLGHPLGLQVHDVSRFYAGRYKVLTRQRHLSTHTCAAPA